MAWFQSRFASVGSGLVLPHFTVMRIQFGRHRPPFWSPLKHDQPGCEAGRRRRLIKASKGGRYGNARPDPIFPFSFKPGKGHLIIPFLFLACFFKYDLIP
jgi:hypothetical protein